LTDTTTVAWDAVAPSWERHHAHVDEAKQPVTDALLSALRLAPGDRVLEIGAGTGTLAAQAAALVGRNGSVVATDASEAMVEAARRTLASLPNTEVAVADAALLEGVGVEFDAVVCRMGLMFLADPLDGVREAHRVLRPGGRLALAVWAGPEHNPWLIAVGMAAMAAGLPFAPPVGPGGPFSLSDGDRLAALLRGGGFADVAVDTVDITFPFADAAEHVALCGSLAPPLAAVLAAASDDQREVVRVAVAEAMSAYRTDDGLRVPGRALVARGRR
jgi:SAM-dependent methyltransferase